MKMDLNTTRRGFIKTAALWGGLGTLIGGSKPVGAKPNQSLPKADEPRPGYRVTAQVKRYYETAGL
jgi:hypothetical protein